MAIRLPRYEARLGIPAQGTGQTIEANLAGARVLQQAGGEMQQLSAAIAQYDRQERERLDEAQYAEKETALAIGHAELRAKYERDTDYNTIEQRYDKEAAELENRILQDASPEVNRRLKLSAQRHSMAGKIDIRNVVTAGRDELKRAEFADKLNEMARTAASAASPDARAATMASADQAIEAMVTGGFIKPTQGQQLREKFRGEVALVDAYRAIDADPQGMVARLREDPSYLGDLEPVQREQVVNAAQVEIRRREAEARREQAEAEARAREARMEARFFAERAYRDELAAALRGETTGQDVGGMVAAGYEEPQAAVLMEELDRARLQGTVLKRMGTMTPDEMRQAIEATDPTGYGYESEAERQDAFTRAAEATARARLENPALEVERNFPDIKEALQSDDPATVAEGIQRSLDIQRRVFGLEPDQIKPLSTEVSSRVVDRFKAAATVDEKLNAIAPLTLGLGDDAAGRAILDQLEASGLPAGVDVALEQVRAGNLSQARQVIEGLTIDPKALPRTGPEADRDVRAALDAAFTEDTPAAALLRASPAAAGRDKALLERLALQNAARGDDAETAVQKALSSVYGNDQAIVEDDLAAVRLPPTVDTSTFRAGATALRDRVDLSALAPKREMFPEGGPGDSQFNLAMMDHERRVQDIREAGVWVNGPGGFYLTDPVSGVALPGTDGKPRLFTLGEIANGAPAEPEISPLLNMGAP